jgi:hypothetical protein
MSQNNVNQENQRIQHLEFHYAQIDPLTGRCTAVFTSSYQIPLPDEYILIPELINDYEDKYYKDGLWYEDSEFTILAEGLN